MSNRLALSVCTALIMFFGAMIIYPIFNQPITVDEIVDFCLFAVVSGFFVYFNYGIK